MTAGIKPLVDQAPCAGCGEWFPRSELHENPTQDYKGEIDCELVCEQCYEAGPPGDYEKQIG